MEKMELKAKEDQISVLLIEDNPGDQVLINNYLGEESDYEFMIKSSFNLSDGLKMLRNEKFDVIILDLGLPDSSGLGGLKAINQLDNSIPVIVLTIDNSDRTGISAIKNGAQDYITKDDIRNRSLSKSIAYAISRKKLELKLKESLSLYESTFEQASIGFAHLSVNAFFLRLNKKFCRILGYSPDDLLGKSIIDITYPEDLENDLKDLEKIISGKINSYTVEKRLMHKDGSIIWANISRTAILNDRNEIKYFFTTIEDITQKKTLELELQRNKDLLENIFSVLPVGVCILDSNRTLISRNKRFDEIWAGSDYNKIEDHKKYEGWLANIESEIINKDWACYKALKNREITLGEIIRIECFDGSRKTIINSAIPIINNGQVVCAVNVIEDITKLAETEAELKKLISEKEMLIKEANHRIKNNLQLISSFIHLQTENVTDNKIKNVLTDSLNRIASISLLHDYLYSSSNLNEVNMQTYLYKIVDRIIVTLLSGSKKIKIIKDIHNFTVDSGLAISIGIILNELITNAAKYAFEDEDNGIIHFEVKLIDKNILFNFNDNGKGLEKNIDFAKAGTLGFQIIYSLINQYGGTIDYEVNKGTMYKIKFPVK